jgi:hypothetical protein
MFTEPLPRNGHMHHIIYLLQELEKFKRHHKYVTDYKSNYTHCFTWFSFYLNYLNLLVRGILLNFKYWPFLLCDCYITTHAFILNYKYYPNTQSNRLTETIIHSYMSSKAGDGWEFYGHDTFGRLVINISASLTKSMKSTAPCVLTYFVLLHGQHSLHSPK